MKLLKPFKANGEEISELNFGFDVFSIVDFGRAEKLAMSIRGASAPEIIHDQSLFIALAFVAACLTDRRLDVEDLKRGIVGSDLLGVLSEGRTFFFDGLGMSAVAQISGVPPGPTPPDSIAQ